MTVAINESEKKSSIVYVEPAQGEEKSRLILECEAMIQGSDFDGETFRRFANNLVDLVGGERNGDGDVRTSYFFDRENSRSIGLNRSNCLSPITLIHIAPEWDALPQEQRKAVEARITDPYLNETVVTRYTSETTVSVMSHTVIYPPNYKGERFVSYGTGEEMGPHYGKRGVNTDSLGETHLSGEQERELASKIFRAWQAQQKQGNVSSDIKSPSDILTVAFLRQGK